jgi:hypothetical protein
MAAVLATLSLEPACTGNGRCTIAIDQGVRDYRIAAAMARCG